MSDGLTEEQKNGNVKSVKAKLQDSNLSDLYKMAKQVAIMMGINDGSKTDEIPEILSKARIPTNHNPAASDRSRFINKGDSITLSSKLQCPFIKTSKCIPSNMKIRISVSKNNDEFVLLAEDNSRFIIYIEDCYLNITWVKQGRIQSNVVGGGGGGGGVPELLGGCELDGAKRRRASATEAARSACQGSCGRGLGAQK